MRIFAIAGMIIFVLFAVVQVNDPDPYIWIPAYLTPAIFSYLALKGKYPVKIIVPFAILFLVFALYTFPPSLVQWVSDELNNPSLSMKTPSMEEARESLGSLICFVFLAVYGIKGYFKKEEKQKYGVVEEMKIKPEEEIA